MFYCSWMFISHFINHTTCFRTFKDVQMLCSQCLQNDKLECSFNLRRKGFLKHLENWICYLGLKYLVLKVLVSIILYLYYITFLSNAVNIEKCNVEKTWKTVGIRNQRHSRLDRIIHLLWWQTVSNLLCIFLQMLCEEKQTWPIGTGKLVLPEYGTNWFIYFLEGFRCCMHDIVLCKIQLTRC